MLEIEMKFPAPLLEDLKKNLQQSQATFRETILEADHYYNAPDRDFRRTDEALRLRRIGEKNFATYKGPKQGGPAKTRKEIEFALRDGSQSAQDFCRLMEHLGYRPVAVVRKQRSTYELERAGFHLEICLDEVDQVGRFVEIEIVTPEDRRPEAENVLTQFADELGLKDQERRSYLQLLVGNK